MAWWPGPGWAPWDDLEAAGIRVVDDPRRVSPPCALVTITRISTTVGCPVEYTVEVALIGPGPENSDAHKWLWKVAVPPLFPHAAQFDYAAWNDYPAVTADIALAADPDI